MELTHDPILEQKKLVLGISLIAEATEYPMPNISRANKMLLKNMGNRCREYENNLYESLGVDGRTLYGEVLGEVEDILNKTK